MTQPIVAKEKIMSAESLNGRSAVKSPAGLAWVMNMQLARLWPILLMMSCFPLVSNETSGVMWQLVIFVMAAGLVGGTGESYDEALKVGLTVESWRRLRVAGAVGLALLGIAGVGITAVFISAHTLWTYVAGYLVGVVLTVVMVRRQKPGYEAGLAARIIRSANDSAEDATGEGEEDASAEKRRWPWAWTLHRGLITERLLGLWASGWATVLFFTLVFYAVQVLRNGMSEIREWETADYYVMASFSVIGLVLTTGLSDILSEWISIGGQRTAFTRTVLRLLPINILIGLVIYGVVAILGGGMTTGQTWKFAIWAGCLAGINTLIGLTASWRGAIIEILVGCGVWLSALRLINDEGNWTLVAGSGVAGLAIAVAVYPIVIYRGNVFSKSVAWWLGMVSDTQD